MKIHSMLARIGTWLMILGILFLLRSFFLLVFLTFVFGFVQARGVDHLGKILPNRKIRVTLVGLAFLGLLSGIALFLTPNLKQQTELFAKHFDTYAHTVDQQIYDWSVTYP
ncbi:MAG TPA: hypothetical protein VLM37_06325, partial [Fibrobacteraceae bacterium]|nr:hypothetical protein [Fibrobacteraceae bacterium]